MTGNRSLRLDLVGLGWIAALIMAVLTAAWVVSIAVVPGPAADVGLDEKLRYLTDHPAAGVIGPSLVAALALLHVPVWLAIAVIVWARRPAAGLLAVAFGLVYAPLASLNYWSQLTVVRGLADLSRSDPAAAAAAYRLFEFPGGLTSFAYAVDVFAYLVWGVAALSAAVGLLALDGRLTRATGWLFALGGLLAIVGAIGFLTRVAVLELGVLLSGIAFLAALVSTIGLLRRAAAMDDQSRELELSLRLRVDPR